MEFDIKKLKDSNYFLNILMQNIDTAVFIADENLHIHQFNDSFLSLFSQPDTNYSSLVETTFGAASGCINTKKENLTCGKTSVCQFCIVRKSLLTTLSTQQPDNKKSIERTFYIDGQPVTKYLEFTSRPITYKTQKMVLVFVYDITDRELSRIQLEEKQRQIDIDLQKAGEIQKHLLPKNIPNVSNIEAAWFFEPCLTIGGDIFHIHKEDDSHVSFYMLDVCGHGVSAALIAVTVKQFLDQLHFSALEQRVPFSPEKILNALEEEFPFERFDCYFTIAYILLDTKTGELLYSCAGHVPPVVIGPENKFEILEGHGMIIGLGQDPPLKHYTSRLNPGDKIILYTDGLIDYFGEKGAAENKNNFYNALQTMTDKSAKYIAGNIIAEQKKFQRTPHTDDDITLLVIEYSGN